MQAHSKWILTGTRPEVRRRVWRNAQQDQEHHARIISQPKCLCVWVVRGDFPLAGTPINNSIVDLAGQLRFLEFEFFEESNINKFWRGIQAAYASQRISQMLPVLRIVERLMIRHTKSQRFNDAPIIELPSLSQDTVYLSFTRAQRYAYRRLFEAAQAKYQSYNQYGACFVVVVVVVVVVVAVCMCVCVMLGVGCWILF
jgi:hypothetical protein